MSAASRREAANTVANDKGDLAPRGLVSVRGSARCGSFDLDLEHVAIGQLIEGNVVPCEIGRDPGHSLSVEHQRMDPGNVFESQKDAAHRAGGRSMEPADQAEPAWLARQPA